MPNIILKTCVPHGEFCKNDNNGTCRWLREITGRNYCSIFNIYVHENVIGKILKCKDCENEIKNNNKELEQEAINEKAK